MTRSPFLDALEAVCAALTDLDAPWMIIDGVAVIAHGVPRSTVDVDATILARAVDPGRVLAIGATRNLRPRITDALAFARAHHVVLLRHETSSVPIDITLAWLPFEEQALGRSLEVAYEGIRLRIPHPEDLIVYKLIAARPRDVEDAEQLLLLHGESVDVARLRAEIREFSEVLEDSERPRTLERLLERTGLA